jgi:hypothetical protein
MLDDLFYKITPTKAPSLTDEQKAKICLLYDNGEYGFQKLSTMFKVPRYRIEKIVGSRKIPSNRIQLTRQDHDDIYQKEKAGDSRYELAIEYGITPEYVTSIIHKLRCKEKNYTISRRRRGLA